MRISYLLGLAKHQVIKKNEKEKKKKRKTSYWGNISALLQASEALFHVLGANTTAAEKAQTKGSLLQQQEKVQQKYLAAQSQDRKSVV